jgi:membrane protease YdiL (CAAX protease family)
MIEAIVILFILFVLPVVLWYFKVIPFRYRFHTFAIIGACTVAIVLAKGWSVSTLGLQGNAVRSYAVPYLLFTLLAGVAVYLIAKLLKRPGTERWWRMGHFLYGFTLFSALQEFVFRGFLIPELQSITSVAWLVILVNALLFTWMHIIYSDDAKALLMIFVGGIGFAAIYVSFPSLVLVSISHMVLNFIAVYFGFFTQERTKERSMI